MASGHLIAVAKGNELKIFNDSARNSHLTAHFIVSKENLKLSPGFRKKILVGMYRKDTTSKYEPLLDILRGGWRDIKMLSALGVYRVNNSIARGKYDESLVMLDSLMRDEDVDSAIRSHCRLLSHSLQALKTAKEPAHLVHAITIDSLQQPPIYPPQDSPTVFWKDERLWLVHEEHAPGQRMRCYDPKNGSWEAGKKIRYPETGLSGLFEKWTTPEGTPDEAPEAGPYRYKEVCWHDKFGANDQEAGEGLDCQPLIQLANPVPDSVRNADYWYPSVDWKTEVLRYFSGSVGNETDLKRAGGSCSAQFGKLEFGERGRLYNSRYHSELWNAPVQWDIFPADIIYGRHEYPALTRPEYRDWKINFPVTRPYPVVVSPNQNWIAFATDSNSKNGYALWVAKLEYKK